MNQQHMGTRTEFIPTAARKIKSEVRNRISWHVVQSESSLGSNGDFSAESVDGKEVVRVAVDDRVSKHRRRISVVSVHEEG